MSVHTRSQRLAQAAYPRVAVRIPPGTDPKKFTQAQKEYRTFAKKFPALIHTCGLAQAVAFAEAKGASKDPSKPKPELQYLDDLAEVLKAAGHPTISNRAELSKQSREHGLSTYLRLSRDALNAAGWLKRYVEAAAGEDE
jgi:CRISPR-associated protein Cmr5